MNNKETIVNITDRPGFRPVLLAWIISVSAIWVIAWYYICGGLATFYSIVFCSYFLSFMLAIVIGRWQTHVGVVYKRDGLRILIRLMAFLTSLLIPACLVGLDIDWYDFLEHPFIETGIYVFCLFLMIIPLYIHTLLCNGTDDLLPFWPSIRYLKSFVNTEPIYGRRGESAVWRALMYLGDAYYPDFEEAPMDEVSFGSKDMTSDYYGKHGEFDTNDRVLAHMEDMQQMSNDPDFVPGEQGYDWDEMMDAKNDGFI